MTARQEQRYQKDRLLLLSRCDRSPLYAVELLESVIVMLGYRLVERCDVPERVLSYCNVDDHTVVVPHDFASRLEYPASAPGVLNATLAHELGHIRLHARRAARGIRRDCWENEAHLYAMVFLAPREQLSAQPEVTALMAFAGAPDLLTPDTQRHLWAHLTPLAERFKVTRSFIARALVAYGHLSMNREQRLLRPLRKDLES